MRCSALQCTATSPLLSENLGAGFKFWGLQVLQVGLRERERLSGSATTVALTVLAWTPTFSEALWR